MIIGKRYEFDAAHHLPGHPKCGKVHGHTWTVLVEVEGKIDSQGMVLDFHKLDQVVKEILNRYDHSDLNNLFDYPTCEVIAVSILSELKKSLGESRKISVRVQEGGGGWARLTK